MSLPNEKPRHDDSPHQTLGSPESVVAQFLQSCQRGKPIGLERLVPDAGSPQRQKCLLAVVKAEMTWLYQQQQTKSIDDYLAQFPELEATPLLSQLVSCELELRREGGESVRLEDYHARFPKLFSHDDPVADQPIVVEPGRTMGDFQLESEIGRGAFSRVYLARQLSLDRTVVVKITESSLSEARTLAQLDHENIVTVFGEETVGDRHLLVMRHVPGVTVDRILARLSQRDRWGIPGFSLLECAGASSDDAGNATVRQFSRLGFVDGVCWLVAGLARGLHHAHQLGILHRDIKPENILISSDGRALLMDFNVAAGSALGGETVVEGGTPLTMSPEQLRAAIPDFADGYDLVDERSDIYSLGIVLFELLTGKQPYVGANNHELLARRLEGPPSFASAGLPTIASLESILACCLAPDPNQRYRSASQLAEDLECVIECRSLKHAPEPSLVERLVKWVRRQPPMVAAFLAGLVVVLTIGGFTEWLEHSAQRSYERGIEHLDQEQYERAAVELERAVERGLREPQVLRDLGLAYYGQRRFAKAVETFDRVINSGFESDELFVARGTALLALGKHDAGERDLKAALRLDPKSAIAAEKLELIPKLRAQNRRGSL